MLRSLPYVGKISAILAMTFCRECSSDRFLNSFAACALRLLSIPVRSDGLIGWGTENRPLLPSSPCSQSINSVTTSSILACSARPMDTFLFPARNCANISVFCITPPSGLRREFRVVIFLFTSRSVLVSEPTCPVWRANCACRSETSS